jgi:ADP-ribose pyrophosphatase YjhB (NUDIX family)
MYQSSKPGVSEEDWIPTKLWKKITEKMPIPCVDLIFQRPNNAILYGWRLIAPYRRVWALLGGRIIRGEDLLECAFRIAKEYGLIFDRLYLNGVFPVNFPGRSDIAISLAALDILGEPRIDGVEFSKFNWSQNPPKRIGQNYLRMVRNWNRISKSRSSLRITRLL